MDCLDFFLSKHAFGGVKRPKPLNFTQYLDMTRRYAIHAKSPYQYEWFSWDNNWLSLRQDASCRQTIKGKIATSYLLTGALWMPRVLKVPDFFEVYPKVVWYDRTCQVLDTWTAWKYYMHVEKIEKVDCGGDIGVQRCLVLRYDYYSAYEKYWYSDRWGWVKWQYWEGKVMKTEFNINRFSKALPYTPRCGGPVMPKAILGLAS